MSDASDADRIEQELPVGEPDPPVTVTPDPEAPEADAFEQALPAPVEDDDRFE
jgi:hypothetical protein